MGFLLKKSIFGFNSIQIKRKRKLKVISYLRKKEAQKILFVIIAAIAFGLFVANISSNSTASSNYQYEELGMFDIPVPTIKYGFALDTFSVVKDEIKDNEFLSTILLKHKVDYVTIDRIARKSKEVWDVKQLRAGKKFYILNKDTTTSADHFIYEPNPFRYVVYDLKDSLNISVTERPIETRVRDKSGVIESSLWNAMSADGLSSELIAKMEDVFGWSIDFHHALKGDKFKLIYEEQLIDGEAVGVGKVLAAHYQNRDNNYYGIRFENDKHSGYYDEEGNTMKKQFLKSPVKYSRISSGYNLRRFHPVLKRTKAHLGTDYAAPRGTPIYAVGDGVVTIAKFKRNNGNYVKIKHNKTYQTQYLHMNGFAKGIRSGVHVKQGQTIGYVGSTGLATGPHVCFRFWKNGRQINHRRLNFPPAEPMPKSDLPRFNILRDEMVARLNAIEVKELEEKKIEAMESTTDSISVNKSMTSAPPISNP